MIGEFKQEKCSHCGLIVNYNYGVSKQYEDNNGRFYFDEYNKCQCGHIINSERINNAKFKGVICL